MPIDTTTETPVPFNQAPQHIPGRPHVSTLHRWRLSGVRGRKLETFLSGGRRFTSMEAIQRFLCPDEAPAMERQAPKLAQRAAAAERELEVQHGI
jgi:hypothetical protein